MKSYSEIDSDSRKSQQQQHSKKKRKVFIYVLRPALFNASLDKKDSELELIFMKCSHEKVLRVAVEKAVKSLLRLNCFSLLRIRSFSLVV